MILVENVLNRSTVSDLSAEKLSLTVMSSKDGTNFSEVSKNGSAFELSEEFRDSTHIRIILQDVTNSQNPTFIAQKDIENSVFNNCH